MIEEQMGWNEFRLATYVVKILNADGEMVKYISGTHLGNLTDKGEMTVMEFVNAMKSGKMMLMKDASVDVSFPNSRLADIE